MYLPGRDRRTELQEIILRKLQDARRWVNKELDQTEQYHIVPTIDGLGFRVGIRSIRAKELLIKLHAEVLSSFNPPEPWLEDHEWSAWFGYAEPFPYTSFRVTFSDFINFQAENSPLLRAEVAKVVADMKSHGQPAFVVDDDSGIPIFEL